jgi:hypothetical protein
MKSHNDPIFQGIRASFLDDSLEEMQDQFRELGGRVLNLERGKDAKLITLLVDSDNYRNALRWCDYIILDEESRKRVTDRHL